jgi:hypothetical protein
MAENLQSFSVWADDIGFPVKTFELVTLMSFRSHPETKARRKEDGQALFPERRGKRASRHCSGNCGRPS